MESNSKVIFALNTLIEMNSLRFRHYNSLAGKAMDSDLKKFFQLSANQSHYFIACLNKWRNAYGASTELEQKFNMISTTWAQLKSVFNSNEKTEILFQSENIERNALKLYRTAIDFSFLPTAIIDDIQKQIYELENVCSTLNALQKSNSSYAISR